MSTAFVTQVEQYVRARYTLLYVVTWEEERALSLLRLVAQKTKKELHIWSVTDGLRNASEGTSGAGNAEKTRKPLAALNQILQSDSAALFVLKDFHTYLEAPEILRQVRDLGSALRRSKKTVIILSPVLTVPPELDKDISVIDLPLPTYPELAGLLKRTLEGAGASRRYGTAIPPQEQDALVRAAQGLTLLEAENAFAQAIIRDRQLSGQDVAVIAEEKRQVIRKSGMLEYCDVDATIAGLGGMDLLKGWLRKRVRAFSKQARDYGLPQPRGVLLIGVQGCGKSLAAKTIAATWGLPLLRMDMSRIFQGYIGSSEQNMRRALQLAESLAPVVLWIDEIEKAFAGVSGSSASDAGTTARVVGTFLTWIQEKKAPVFVTATANAIEALPPELIRKGRFDECFFVDLPAAPERKDIFAIHLRRRRRDPEQFDLDTLASASQGFSGAEIEQAIVEALHESFFEEREVTTADIANALRGTVPLTTTMAEDIARLRNWAGARTRPASSSQLKIVEAPAADG
jgi:AAA+ superfamily predicted ATPase